MTVQEWLNTGGGDEKPLPYPLEGDIVFPTCVYIESDDLFRIDGNYNIEADRILSGTSFVDWIWQLHHKTWFTQEHYKDFLDCLFCYIHREHNGQFPQVFYHVAGGGGGLDEP